MRCLECKNDPLVLAVYNQPDSYERAAGIESVHRKWVKCRRCGLIYSVRDYAVQEIERVYEDAYRSQGFRGEGVKEAYDRIQAIPEGESENLRRLSWLKERVPDLAGPALDIGSGLGVFPARLKEWIGDVTCWEPNELSRSFIEKTLGLPCHGGFFKSAGMEDRFRFVSCVHVLEHQDDPEQMLMGIRDVLEPSGIVYIEVPDAREFDYLPHDHDEFNSCHVYFFSASSLFQLMRSCGLRVTNISLERTRARNLARIYLLAEKVTDA